MDNIESRLSNIENQTLELNSRVDEVLLENERIKRSKEKAIGNVISENNGYSELLEDEAVGILQSYERLKTENGKLKQEINEILEESGERVLKRILECAKKEYLRTGNNPFDIQR